MCDLNLERDVLYEAIVSIGGQTSYVTQKQVKALASLVSQGLQNKKRENRIAVMHYLIGDAIRDSLGVELTSFRNMTSRVATMLIDRFKAPNGWGLSDYARDLLSQAEAEVALAA